MNILYEDNHVLVAVKPPNMLSQGDSTGDTDLLTLLKEYLKQEYQKPGNVYLGLVHRLDRPVGGLMVFARTSKAAARLSEQMRRHEMGREYLCIVNGAPEDTFTLEDYLWKDPIRNRVVVCEADQKGSQLAVLHGRCLARREGTALCAIRLETGRKHQIRAQMSHAGLPLWGDNRYGGGIPGQQIALWGYKLTFLHPTTRRIMRFFSMPEGNVWSLYGDILTVPENTEEPENPREIHLSDQVIRAIRGYNGKIYGSAEEDAAAPKPDPERKTGADPGQEERPEKVPEDGSPREKGPVPGPREKDRGESAIPGRPEETEKTEEKKET